MTHQTPAVPSPAPADPGQQIAQLYHALMLVRQISGSAPDDVEGRTAAFDQSARIGTAFGDASPIVRRRFDALLSETTLWAATGVEALLAGEDDTRPRAAAARLAEELARALRDLSRLLGV